MSALRDCDGENRIADGKPHHNPFCIDFHFSAGDTDFVRGNPSLAPNDDARLAFAGGERICAVRCSRQAAQHQPGNGQSRASCCPIEQNCGNLRHRSVWRKQALSYRCADFQRFEKSPFRRRVLCIVKLYFATWVVPSARRGSRRWWRKIQQMCMWRWVRILPAPEHCRGWVCQWFILGAQGLWVAVRSFPTHSHKCAIWQSSTCFPSVIGKFPSCCQRCLILPPIMKARGSARLQRFFVRNSCLFPHTTARAGGKTKAGYHQTLENLFNLTPPTALIIGDSEQVPRVVSFLLRHQLRYPEDVSLVVLDEAEELQQYEPPISYLKKDNPALVKIALNSIRKKLAQLPDEELIISPAKLVLTGSVAKTLQTHSS